MSKLLALLNVFRFGSEVANPTLWKMGHISGSVVAGLILAMAHFGDSVGYHVAIDQVAADKIAAAILIIANIFIVPATSKKVGLLPPKSQASDKTDGTTDETLYN